MSSKTTARKLSRWQHWYRGALPAYWVYLVCMTHFPRLRLKTHVTAADKVAHVVCFALLAFLFWRFAETFRKPAPPWLVWLALAWLGLYAALDEWTQSFVAAGRTYRIGWRMLGIMAVLAS